MGIHADPHAMPDLADFADSLPRETGRACQAHPSTGVEVSTLLGHGQ
ncbi:hypothetical protein [Saccharopolyspora spinosa]|nr:hypothetical protein [Saccharopolyspora spinosa]